ncbi:DeoR/GlpR family DNA-binding transcription regulator [Aquitalea sp. LB_tupeE]|uniref:DeoR/GlpR family DNA-binding transcription regulator n=1 Tax=Aquitalea sp. LB_tupeE TaxID=2748078 RepID=UPI0015B880F0|nr:DeoR/GlpR family DNA-binding transcription regulator [Aquitalea sp. LB_tupeE]NWK78186.1 DeoR/GlpR transcriptional regulator [Aquitalea sp. LB_tupeE]
MKIAGKQKPHQRQETILDLVREHKKISVERLSALTASSCETIRRDLTVLASRGKLKKYHGGAMSAEEPIEHDFRLRRMLHAEEKQRIARLAASLFKAGDSLLIDTGTTTLALAQELARKQHLTIITNSLAIAQLIGRGDRSNKVFLIGGEYLADASESVGGLAITQIQQFNTTDVVLTVGAIDENGVMDFSLQEADIAKAMLAQARRLTVIADSSKFGASALFRVCGLEKIHRLVVNCAPDPILLHALQQAHVEVHIVDTHAPAPIQGY